MEPTVYWKLKLAHSGATAYKCFEGFNRRVKESSLANLKGVKYNELVVKAAEDVQPAERTLNHRQSRRVRSMCQKLAYYSAERKFSTSKGKKYAFKVSFITLTAPQNANPAQMLAAFEKFLDYLRRTANCVYVWKKELGEKSGKLHFHLMLNNFIPYYIVSWKWKRLLMAEGVEWPLNEKGQHTDSHYRIELPANKKHVARYIAKYLSKAFGLPREYGYVAGHSAVIDECKELHLFPGDYSLTELEALREVSFMIVTDYLCHFSIDLIDFLHLIPTLGSLFRKQVIEFSERLTLPQKFSYV